MPSKSDELQNKPRQDAPRDEHSMINFSNIGDGDNLNKIWVSKFIIIIF